MTHAVAPETPEPIAPQAHVLAEYLDLSPLDVIAPEQLRDDVMGVLPPNPGYSVRIYKNYASPMIDAVRGTRILRFETSAFSPLSCLEHAFIVLPLYRIV